MNIYRENFEELARIANEKSTANHVKTQFGSFCDYIQYITYDALDPKDYPNGIAQNSIFITFSIDYRTSKVEIHSGGHVWLSSKDKNSDAYRYYAMRGMIDIAEEYGVKKFRKSKFKNAEDLFNKTHNYYVAVMNAVKNYTGNIYPYKEGIQN